MTAIANPIQDKEAERLRQEERSREFTEGKYAYEKGRYTQSVELLELALEKEGSMSVGDPGFETKTFWGCFENVFTCCRFQRSAATLHLPCRQHAGKLMHMGKRSESDRRKCTEARDRFFSTQGLGGDIQLWLALAYQAAGRDKDCIDLYKRASRCHPVVWCRCQP